MGIGRLTGMPSEAPRANNAKSRAKSSRTRSLALRKLLWTVVCDAVALFHVSSPSPFLSLNVALTPS